MNKEAECVCQGRCDLARVPVPASVALCHGVESVRALSKPKSNYVYSQK